MSLDVIKKKVSMGTIGVWVLFFITTLVMILLLFGEIFSSEDFWIPLIPIGVLLILAITATVVDLVAERRNKVGVIGIWTIFALTTVVMIALIIGVFEPDEIWIPIIPIGSVFILAVVATIFDYLSGEVRFCPKCGKVFEKKWDFCQECGMRVLMTCPSCGIKVKGNPKFCHKCGTNLSEVEFVQVTKAPSKYIVEEQAQFCHHCGGPSNPEAKYCGFCGTQQ